jgi:hypothetical protein
LVRLLLLNPIYALDATKMEEKKEEDEDEGNEKEGAPISASAAERIKCNKSRYLDRREESCRSLN